jgi:hypothetical protein
MRGEERLPRRRRAALRSWLDAVVLEDRFDRVASDVVAETFQRAADACVAPSRVVGHHAYDKGSDVGRGVRATRTSRLRAVVLLGDERPVPAEDGVGCHDAGNARELTTAEDLAFDCETASLVVREVQSARTVSRAEDSVLLKRYSMTAC